MPPPQNAASELPRFDPASRVFFVYGADAAKVSRVRRELVARLVPAEERDQNFTEIESPATGMLSLDAVGSRLMEELSTPAFFPDQRRVVLIGALKELFGGAGAGGRKKAAPKPKKGAKPAPTKRAGDERLIEFLEGSFRESKSALIIAAEEDDDKQRKVDAKKPLPAWLINNAVVVACLEPPARFEFEQALYDRHLARAVALYRDWINPDTRANVLSAISNAVRMMLQVKARDSSQEARRSPAEYFPAGRGSIATAHRFVIQKAEGGARNYSLGELVRAHARLLELNDAFYPPKGATFVPELNSAVEGYLLRLCLGG